jgi:putative FmdB family regulatory protein
VPIYEYRCENGHTFEVFQRMSDEPVTECEVCGAPVQRVFHPIAVHFKGSGFYNTDYKGKGKVPAESKSGDSSAGDSSSASESSSSGDSKKSDSKSDSGSKSSDSGSKAKSGSSD